MCFSNKNKKNQPILSIFFTFYARVTKIFHIWVFSHIPVLHLQGKEDFERQQKELLEKENIIKQNQAQLGQEQVSKLTQNIGCCGKDDNCDEHNFKTQTMWKLMILWNTEEQHTSTEKTTILRGIEFVMTAEQPAHGSPPAHLRIFFCIVRFFCFWGKTYIETLLAFWKQLYCFNFFF